MDHNLVRSWLGLPPGPWPPDHYAILGLPPGRVDAAAVEACVLERMDRLRPHQLRQPELVTDGMNRLAQALIALSDPAEKAAYDREFGFAGAVLPPEVRREAAESPRVSPIVVAQAMYEVVEPEAVAPRIASDPDATIIVEIEPFLPATAVERDRSALPRVNLIDAEVAAERTVAARREIYARLALIRRAVRAWERFRPIVEEPEELLDRPARVLLMLEAARAIVPLATPLAGVIGSDGHAGSLTLALLKRPLHLDTVRGLLPDQRLVLKADWRDGLESLQNESARLRQRARNGRSLRRETSAARDFARWMRDTPELVLVLLIVLLALIVAIR